jgi:biopolymer transport protein ExbD
MELIALLLFVLVIASMMRADTRLVEEPQTSTQTTPTATAVTN